MRKTKEIKRKFFNKKRKKKRNNQRLKAKEEAKQNSCIKMAMSRLSKLSYLSKEYKLCSSMLLRGFLTNQNNHSYNVINKMNSYSTLPNANQNYEWKTIFQDAQNSVGYPTSYENLRWLLSDKFASVGHQLRKLASSKNNLQKTAK